MSIPEFANVTEDSFPIAEELTFLRQQTGQGETSILAQALHLGLHALYRQTAEQLFIDGTLSREKALEILGEERVHDIEYAQYALEKDIVQGLHL